MHFLLGFLSFSVPCGIGYCIGYNNGYFSVMNKWEQQWELYKLAKKEDVINAADLFLYPSRDNKASDQ